MSNNDEVFSAEETESRRKETLQYMLGTPPQQHASHSTLLAKSRKKGRQSSPNPLRSLWDRLCTLPIPLRPGD
jgi:hypothetical protein